MSFTARYDGFCAWDECDDSIITRGSEVEYVDDELMHYACATRARRQSLAPLCDTCFTHHRGEC